MLEYFGDTKDKNFIFRWEIHLDGGITQETALDDNSLLHLVAL